jgi:hypothetical protein
VIAVLQRGQTEDAVSRKAGAGTVDQAASGTKARRSPAGFSEEPNMTGVGRYDCPASGLGGQ